MAHELGALSGEAGLTAEAAKVAGGFSDEKLHAGFINKQTPLPPASQGAVGKIPEEVLDRLVVTPAEDREPDLDSSAGATESSAAAAGKSGVADHELHAGFITKQTPLE